MFNVFVCVTTFSLYKIAQTVCMLRLPFALFSILLFYSTVCFHFAEQIDDDDDDEVVSSGRAQNRERLPLRNQRSITVSRNQPLTTEEI